MFNDEREATKWAKFGTNVDVVLWKEEEVGNWPLESDGNHPISTTLFDIGEKCVLVALPSPTTSIVERT